MRMRALLALLVIGGMLPVQGGTGANTGRADSGPTFLFLDTGGGSNNLSLAQPSSIGSVVLGRNMTASFTVANFSALSQNGLHYFLLNLSVVSLNMSGMKLSCNLRLDYFGNGSLVKVLPFLNYTTTTSMQTEHAIIGENGAIDHNFYITDLRRGGLRLELTRIDDSDGLVEILCGSGEDQSYLSIPYGAPLRADAGPDRAAKSNQTVELNASLSEMVDPDATEYLWNFGNGMTGAGRLAAVAYDSAGNYTVTLTLRWNGLEANDSLVVRVADNLHPEANAGFDVTKRVGENTTFRGAGTDQDGVIVSYSWSFGDGFNASGQNATHSFSAPGNYTVVLTVTDDGGATGRDSLQVRVNHPPRITNITAVQSGNLVDFRITAFDPDGPDLFYAWDFGDGTNGSGPQPSHRFTLSGKFTARCNVTDPYGEKASAEVNITIVNSAPRIMNLGISGTTFAVNEAVRFKPTASDPDNNTLTYRWFFGDGTGSQDQNAVHYYTKAGRFNVTLRVSDGITEISQSSVVEINDAAGPAIDPATLVGIGCIALFLIAAIFIGARAAAAARRREVEGGGVQQYGGVQTQPYGGVPTQTYGGSTQPYGGATYQPYGGQYQQYGGGYQPAQAPRPPRAPKAPPGVCPRCGSTDHHRFPDGHTKCNNCKKIFFTG